MVYVGSITVLLFLQSGILVKRRKGVIRMATKSILKTVDIRDKKLGRTFARALEVATKKKQKEVKYSHDVRDARTEDIKKFFGA